MKPFPAYVPEAVRKKIASMIEGDSWNPHGWRTSLTSAQEKFTALEDQLRRSLDRGEFAGLDELRTAIAEQRRHCATIATDIACLERFGHDGRMREAYALLTRVFEEDEQWTSFIHATWAARVDFSAQRQRVQHARELGQKISEAATDLAVLLREYSKTGIEAPDEFFSVTELLRKTDHPDTNNAYMWRVMRPQLLGDRTDNMPASPVEEKRNEAESSGHIDIRFIQPSEAVKIDPEDQRRNDVRYAWAQAPEVPDLLMTLARAAHQLTPKADGLVGAAVESRQFNSKTAYLRACLFLLQDRALVPLTSPYVLEALAVTANVALNDPDIDVSLADVRASASKILNPRQQNPAEK